MTKIDNRMFNGEGRRLSSQVSKSMRKYFKELEGEIAKDVYSMVLKEVELPLLEIVMEQCKDNQTQASQMLGINRGTLRNKLKEYKLL
jgi:Fis family transcriptional regulator